MKRFVKYLTKKIDTNSEKVFSEWLEETKTVLGTLQIDLDSLLPRRR